MHRRHAVIVNGLSIAAIGMPIIFGFLIILVAAMFGLNAALRKFFPKSLIAQADHGKPATGSVSGGATSSSAIVAVAVASIKAHIAVHRG
jgi:sodium pump decarboxylase gamma subunit